MFFIEGYLEISFSSILNLKAFTEAKDFSDFLGFFSGWANIYASLVTIVSLFGLVIIPVFIIERIHKHFANKRKLRRKYGIFMRGLSTETKMSTAYDALFMLSRLLSVFTIVLLHDYPYYQIQVFLWINLINIIILISTRPFKNKSKFKLELFNR